MPENRPSLPENGVNTMSTELRKLFFVRPAWKSWASGAGLLKSVSARTGAGVWFSGVFAGVPTGRLPGLPGVPRPLSSLASTSMIPYANMPRRPIQSVKSKWSLPPT
jgi:hypothetical protein